MNFLRRPFTLGSKTLPSNVFCAPLAGCSDFPFRKMTSSYKPGLIYCEMVKTDALVRNDPHTYRMLDYDTSMHPIGAQLCGSKVEQAGICGKILEDLGFDVIDLNCGCPVDKVTKDGSGSGLLRNPEKIGEMIAAIKAKVSIPVTVKIRAGWDSSSIVVEEITRIAEAAGASAICVHGRTRVQGYKGFSDRKYIRACKQAAKNILVIANGDIFDPLSAQTMFEETGCDAVLLARGTMGTPWLIEDIYTFSETGTFSERSSLYRKEAFLSHLDKIFTYQTERRGLLDVRRIAGWYLKQGKGTKSLRESVIRSESYQEILSHIERFPWEETEFSSGPILQAQECCAAEE